jgi:predicted secreted hydrolase
MPAKKGFFRIILVFFIIVFLLAPSFSASFSMKSYIREIFNIDQSTKSTEIQTCFPKDDAFHGSTPFPSIEWWYFDSMFTQNYSAHIGFKIFTYQGFNLLKPTINIYQGTTLIVNETTLIPPSEFFVSSKHPEIQIGDSTVLSFNKSAYDQYGEWQYHIDYFLDNVGVNLTFFSTTQGWTYETEHEGWTVAIPKGTVEGQLYINDKKIEVNGRGYHDHNWNFSFQTPVRGWSWYWGKLTGETLNLAWAIIKDTGIVEQTFADRLGVLNTQKQKFIVIDSENITFSPSSYIFKDNRFIPTTFTIEVKQNDVYIDITFSTLDLHRSDPTVLTAHYWRYFVSASGIISYGDTVEYLNEKIQIMEYMRFV